MNTAGGFSAVLFDLDGTLADSAPDLVAALSTLSREIGEPEPDPIAVSRVVSTGGRAILRCGLPRIAEERIEELLPRYLHLYAERGNVSTRLYEGIDEVLRSLEARGIPWGIVTNKVGWLAAPVIEQLGLKGRCSALVAGDRQRRVGPASLPAPGVITWLLMPFPVMSTNGRQPSRSLRLRCGLPMPLRARALPRSSASNMRSSTLRCISQNATSPWSN